MSAQALREASERPAITTQAPAPESGMKVFTRLGSRKATMKPAKTNETPNIRAAGDGPAASPLNREPNTSALTIRSARSSWLANTSGKEWSNRFAMSEDTMIPTATSKLGLRLSQYLRVMDLLGLS
jgi:hypothetical protein